MSSAVEWPINNEDRYREHKENINYSLNCPRTWFWCPFVLFQKFDRKPHQNICDALRDLRSVTVWRLHGCSNACEFMLTLFSTFMPFLFSMAFERVYQMTNVWMPFKRVNSSNLMTFECCFLISWYHENCHAMSSFTVLRHVPWNTFICSAVQCFH